MFMVAAADMSLIITIIIITISAVCLCRCTLQGVNCQVQYCTAVVVDLSD